MDVLQSWLAFVGLVVVNEMEIGHEWNACARNTVEAQKALESVELSTMRSLSFSYTSHVPYQYCVLVKSRYRLRH